MVTCCSSADTIFFGGGTPSLLTPGQFEQIFRAIHANFTLSDPEISLEANPGTVTRESLQALRGIGFNRISFGVQSFDDRELQMIGRSHNGDEARRAVEAADEELFTHRIRSAGGVVGPLATVFYRVAVEHVLGHARDIAGTDRA